MCTVSFVVHRDLLEDTQTDYVKSTSADLFFFFHAPKTSHKPLEFLLYKTNRLHISVRVYCNRSHKTSLRVKNNSRATRLRLVSYFLFLTCCDAVRENVIHLFNYEGKIIQLWLYLVLLQSGKCDTR